MCFFFRKRGIQAKPEPTALAHVAERALLVVHEYARVCRVAHLCVKMHLIQVAFAVQSHAITERL